MSRERRDNDWWAGLLIGSVTIIFLIGIFATIVAVNLSDNQNDKDRYESCEAVAETTSDFMVCANG